ncbi:MAG: dolichyl-phosphate beta-glucosyltransferase [Thelocarpon impressellum]|nr:MAG: dolichyl-phosphate beta-glucosyltransferase [Thelocarpon impressellum]
MALQERAAMLWAAVLDVARTTPPTLILLLVVTGFMGFASMVRERHTQRRWYVEADQVEQLYLALFIVAPVPRAPRPSEKRFQTILPGGEAREGIKLSCWQDGYNASRDATRRKGDFSLAGLQIEPAEVFVSLVVPAYNEEERLGEMLEEAVAYLREEYGASRPSTSAEKDGVRSRKANGKKSAAATKGSAEPAAGAAPAAGWEILVVSDGSTDGTVKTALDFARKHDISFDPSASGPEESLRVVCLEDNRGKGGAVVHGMRHVRGEYVCFADADGASRFTDLGALVKACREAADTDGKAVAVGSRAHLVGSEAVVKRSFLRNLLMHSFHLLLRLLTPPATAAIKDTQCGFKLFSRAALPDIVPYMHSEGWIFDVEMLMLAESAGIPVAEVAVGWKEVKGSKLNVVWDSLGMAWGLAVLRGAWGLGVYRRN